MPPAVSEERVLNVFREAETETLTTDDLVDALPVGRRAVQGYVRDLEEDGRLVLAEEGKPNHWRLANTEPKTPVYKPELARAKRVANWSSKYGRLLFESGVAILATAGLVTSNHIFTRAFGVYLPFLDAHTVAVATIVGVVGSILFVASFVAFALATFLPRIVERRLDGSVPDDA